MGAMVPSYYFYIRTAACVLNVDVDDNANMMHVTNRNRTTVCMTAEFDF